jgi:hypothetical protein
VLDDHDRQERGKKQRGDKKLVETLSGLEDERDAPELA